MVTRRGTVRVMAAVAVAVPALAWAGADAGIKKYIAHQFDEAIEECKGGRDVPSRIALALSYTERYNIYKNKADKDAAAMWMKPLLVDITVADATAVERFLNIDGNPNGNKEANNLLKKALDAAKSTPEDIMLLAKFVDPAKGPDANYIAINAIQKRLAPVREYVNKGGTMPKEMQEVFSDKNLIKPLTETLANKKNSSYARKCLVLIEEPCVPHLEEKSMTKEISDAVVDVKKAIQARQKKYPNSTWFSAAGK